MALVRRVYDRLRAHYGPQAWWPADTPFEVIVGALLMQQASWGRVEEAIGNLRAAGLLEVRRIAAAPVATLRRHVRVAGLYRAKPTRLKAFCRNLLARADGDLDLYFSRPTDVVRADLLAQSGRRPRTRSSSTRAATPCSSSMR